MALQRTKDQREEDFIQYKTNTKDLMKYQREYKALIKGQTIGKSEAMINRNIVKNIKNLYQERDDLKTNFMVAMAPVYLRELDKHMEIVEDHIGCQEKISDDINRLKHDIRILEKQNYRLDKEFQEKSRKVKTDSEYQLYIQKTRHALTTLENQLDTTKRRVSTVLAQNVRLRRVIIDQLNTRTLFNKLWHKMISQLDHDRKYLVDLVEFAMGTFGDSIDIYNKFEAVNTRGSKELEVRRLEMQNLIRQINADLYNYQFQEVKNKARTLEDLEPREYKRREIFKTMHENKIRLYRDVRDKIISFSGVRKISQAIQKFKKQQSLYYSYFNYTNQVNYQVTVLNDRINELFNEIEALKESQQNNVETDLSTIAVLRKKLVTQQTETTLKLEEKERKESRIMDLLTGINEIFLAVRADNKPLLMMLGDHSKVTMFNVSRFLKILEDKLNDVLAHIYASQRADKRRKPETYTVREVGRKPPEPTDVDDIVLATECAECAEGEEVNPYDVEFVEPLSKEQVRAKLREKVVAPEMQYRLHALEECRLPRSRQLADKKY